MAKSNGKEDSDSDIWIVTHGNGSDSDIWTHVLTHGGTCSGTCATSAHYWALVVWVGTGSIRDRWLRDA
jgi:hypothetical protein